MNCMIDSPTDGHGLIDFYLNYKKSLTTKQTTFFRPLPFLVTLSLLFHFLLFDSVSHPSLHGIVFPAIIEDKSAAASRLLRFFIPSF